MIYFVKYQIKLELVFAKIFENLVVLSVNLCNSVSKLCLKTYILHGKWIFRSLNPWTVGIF